MSTNSECQFYEVRRGQWYYVLEDYDAPKNSWDWREHASAYGPFPGKDEAFDHLGNHHANPGGHGINALPAGVEALDIAGDEVMQRLIAEARPASWPETLAAPLGRMPWR